MSHRLFLCCEDEQHAKSLRPIFQALHLEVVDAPEAWVRLRGRRPRIAASFCPLAVVVAGIRRMEPIIVELRRQKLASKMLAMVPFDLHGKETHFVGLGADDVLSFPVSRARLELTLRNLLRLYFLERAGIAADPMERAD